MTLITKLTQATGLDVDMNSIRFQPQIAGDLVAGEALPACSPVAITATGTVVLSDGTAADDEANVDGWVVQAYPSGATNVTVFNPNGIRMRYATGLTPAARLFLGATAGRLDDSATTGDTVGIARAINTTDIITLGFHNQG